MRKRKNKPQVAQRDILRWLELGCKSPFDMTVKDILELEDLNVRMDLGETEEVFGPHPNRGKYT